MVKQRKQYENKVFLYTTDCSFCGDAFPADEAKLRGIVKDNNRELVVKQVELFNGWRMEAESIARRLEVELPFYWDYNTDTAIPWTKVYVKTNNQFKPVSLNEDIFREFLGGNINVKSRKSESPDSETN